MSSSLVTMKVPPKKPHFFKPIMPGFKNGIKIPKGFLKYLEGQEEHEHAILRRNCKEWQVKLNGCRFEEGWAEFAQDHNLQVEDVLVFRHEGNMEFEVTIFDSSQCNRQYAEHQQEEGEETAKKSDWEDLRRNETEKPESKSKTSVKAFSKLGATKDKHLIHPHFNCIIRPYCLSTTFLVIPTQFARRNKLNNRKCTISMRDEQRSWTFSLYTSGRNTYFGRGWREFCIENRVKEGDRLMFEIVSNGETPVFRFYDLRGNAPLQPRRKKTNLDVQSVSTQGLDQSLGAVFGVKKGNGIVNSYTTAPKAQASASISANANPHFVSTIQPYSIDHHFLYLPSVFAKTNGLFNRRCEMILINEKWRSWSVHLRPMSHHTGIYRGWKQFKEANDVQLGDTFKFELINNEELPVVYFHCKYAGKDAPGIREALDKVMEQLMMGNGKEP